MHVKRRSWQLKLAALAGAIVAAACSGQPANPQATGANVATNAAEATSSAGGWFDAMPIASAEGSDDGGEDGAQLDPPSDGPDDPMLGVAAPDDFTDVAENPDDVTALVELPAIDPCSLVTASEWASWANQQDGSPIPLEDGEACGWAKDDDSVRMAIGVFPNSGAAGYLSAADAAALGGQPESGIGESALWVRAWPVPQSSTLIITTGHLDVVVEISTRAPVEDSWSIDAARHFGAVALARLP